MWGKYTFLFVFLVASSFARSAAADASAVVILPLDEGSGNVAGDTSGRGNNGTLQNGALFDAETADGSASAVRFDGVNDSLDLGLLDVNGSGLTLAAWFKADSFPGPSGDPRLISKASGTDASDHVFMLSLIRSGGVERLRARVRTNGSTKTVIASSGNITAGVWRHAAATYDGTRVRLYLDGVLVGSAAVTGAVDRNPSLRVAAGSQPPGAGPRFFDGLIDDVRIYERGLSASEIAAIITGSGTPPSAVDDSYSVASGSTLSVNAASGVLSNDTDPDGDPLAAVLASSAAHGALDLAADGSFDYTPALGFSGVDSFTYRASDGALESNVATVMITVNATNRAPVAQNDSYSVAAGSTLTISAASGVLANDSDPDGNPLTAVLASTVSNGDVSLASNGSFTYTPDPGFSGPDSFTYRARDGALSSNLATVTITVNATNRAPVAQNDSYTATAGSTLTVNAASGVLANDSDPDGDPLTTVLGTNVSHGSLALAANGSFTYTPAAGYSGPDSFTYRARDGALNSNLATVTITVNATNRTPVAQNDSYTATAGSTLTVNALSGVLANDNDPDGDPLTALLGTTVSHGTLALASNGSFTYTPAAGYSGPDSFTYRARDGALNSNLATAAITVNGGGPTGEVVHLPLDEAGGTLANDVSGRGNDGTLLNGAVFAMETADGSASSVRFDGINDSIDLGPIDVNGTGLTLAAWFKADSFPGPSSDPRLISKASGTAANDHVFMLSTISAGGAVRLRARIRTNGSTKTVIATSGNLATGTWYHGAVTYDGSTVRLYVDGAQVGAAGLTGAVGRDPSLPVAIGSQPAGGGPRYFDGLIDDVRILERALSAAEIAAIISGGTGGNSPPFALGDGYSTTSDSTLAVNASNGVLSNDSDPEGDSLTAVLESDVAHGTLTLSQDGSFQYTPLPGFSGTDSFAYRASDGDLVSNLVSVTLGVNVSNRAPVAANDSYSVTAGTTLTVNAASGVLANDSDPDGDPLTAVLASNVSHGTLSLASNGSFNYTPNAGFSGTDSFTYCARDGDLDSNRATVTITVGQGPTAVDDTYSVNEDSTLTVSQANGVLANDLDNDPPDDLMAFLSASPAHGTLSSFQSGGSFTYTPVANFHGVDSFTYQAVESASGAGSEATVIINVSSVNDPPVANSNAFAVSPSLSTLLFVDDLLANDNDVDGDALLFASFTQPVRGSLTNNNDGTLTYTPPAGFSGTDSFTYKASDGQALSASATVSLSAAVANDAPRIVSGTAAFVKRVIDNTVDECHFAPAADLTGDGELDIVATNYVDGIVTWYENNGNGNFTRRVLDANLEGAYPAYLADVDLDGDIDALAGGYLADTLAWYQNNGSGSFTKRVIDAAADGVHSMVTVDMDGDGDIDLVTSNQDAGTVYWYQNNGSQAFTRRTIDLTATGAKRADFADLDNDGDIDVCSAAFFTREISWYQNNGSQSFTKRVIDSTMSGAYYVSPADLNGDGDIDLMAAGQTSKRIAWYANNGNGTFTRILVDTAAAGARTVIPTDLDRDGDIDMLATVVDDNRITWYVNNGSGGFVAQNIDTTTHGPYGICAVDMDHDGDIDVVSASRDDNAVAIHTQTRTHTATIAQRGTLAINRSRLLTVDSDDGPSQLTYRITTAPAFGQLRVGGVAIGQNGTFTQADVDAGRVVYVHSGGTAADNFAFTVADGGEGGVLPATGTFRIVISG